MPTPISPYGTVQNRTVTNASAQSAAFAKDTTRVRLVANTNTWLKFAADPTAVTTDIYLPANVVQDFSVKAGEKLAAIRDTADGKLSILEY